MPRKDPDAYREYRREYMFRRYHEDPEHRARVDANKRATVARRIEQFAAYKATLSCERCGESRTPCLDFHHRDGSQKDTAVGAAVHRGWSFERIMVEVAKCEVLCANCHRMEHYGSRP